MFTVSGSDNTGQSFQSKSNRRSFFLSRNKLLGVASDRTAAQRSHYLGNDVYGGTGLKLAHHFISVAKTMMLLVATLACFLTFLALPSLLP